MSLFINPSHKTGSGGNVNFDTTPKVCKKAVEEDLWSLDNASDHLKIQNMCNKAVQEDSKNCYGLV